MRNRQAKVPLNYGFQERDWVGKSEIIILEHLLWWKQPDKAAKDRRIWWHNDDVKVTPNRLRQLLELTPIPEIELSASAGRIRTTFLGVSVVGEGKDFRQARQK